jgi:type IV secretory pathway TrbD component
VFGGRVRQWWLLAPGVGAQFCADHLLSGAPAQVVLLAGYAVLAVFLLANRLLVGVGIVAVGLAANALVVMVDGGMPVRSSAVISAGLAGVNGPAAPPAGARHHLEGPGDHLVVLDDHLAVGAVHRVVSYGDVILVVGTLDVVVHLALGAWAPRTGLRRARHPVLGAPIAV